MVRKICQLIMKQIIIAFLVFVGATNLFGQELDNKGCGTHGTTTWFEYYMDHRDEFDNDYPEMIEYVPMTIHILGDDEGVGYFPLSSLFVALCQLNEDFAPMNIQFYIKDEIDYINNDDWYIHPRFNEGYTMMNRNNIDGTVNCYFVADPAGNCGYFAPSGDAVALSKSCSGPNSHTWAHEIGHFFSLPHTFVGWEGTDYDGFIPGGNRRGVENVARDNCRSTADRFCDTPADYLSFRWNCDNQGRSTIVQKDRNGVEFTSDGTLIMSYSSDGCQNRFSDEQIDVVNANLRTERRNLRSTPTVLSPIDEQVTPVEPMDSGVASFEDGTLTWNKVEHATGYQVLVSRIPTLQAGFIVDEVVTDTTIDLPDLFLGSKYYWKVIPFNNFYTCYDSSKDRFSFTAAALTSSRDINSKELRVFPVPLPEGETILNLQGIENNTEYNWEIYDIHGRLVSSGDLNTSQIELQRGIQSGIYSLLVFNDQEILSSQIVVD